MPVDPISHHRAEQRWALVSAALDHVIKLVTQDEEFVARCTESTDLSALFDYVYMVILMKDRTDPEAFLNVELLCAAAISRLVRTPRTEDPLEQYEKEMGEHTK